MPPKARQAALLENDLLHCFFHLEIISKLLMRTKNRLRHPRSHLAPYTHVYLLTAYFKGHVVTEHSSWVWHCSRGWELTDSTPFWTGGLDSW